MTVSVHTSINRYKASYLKPNLKYLIRKYILGMLVRVISYLGYLLSYIIPKFLCQVERPIFIIGCSRSGTTLFGDMFAKQGELIDWSEAGFFYELDYYNPNIDHLKRASDVTSFHRRRMETILGLLIWITRKSRYVNHHPQNSMRIPFLKEIFPDAVFIHLIRDGRAVVRSNFGQIEHESFRQNAPFGYFPKPVKWREYQYLPCEVQFALQWKDLIEFVRSSAANHLTDSTYLEIRYEDFCGNTHEILQTVDEFCGLKSDLRKYKEIPSEFKMQNHKWKVDFSPSQVDKINKTIKPLLKMLGYY